MDVAELIRKAKAEGRTALTEAESKEVLRQFGVPVVAESVAATPEEAVAKAQAIGFPVVLKGLGTKLTHKTERGLVRLNLKDDGEVRQAAAAVAASAGADLEGYLIQPMLSGRREFVAGLFHDSQFGPVVMFGLGGIFTEALNDVAFRIAPVDEKEAEQMIDELHSRKLLGPFRGEQAAGRERLIRTLTGLSRVGLELPDVTEADINPLLVGPDGQATAVDALIILGERPAAQTSRPPVDPVAIAKLFYPRSIAFVGASGTFAKWGYMLFCNVAAGGFKGPIYLVNAKGGEIAGRPAFKVGRRDSRAGRSGRRDHPGRKGLRPDPAVQGKGNPEHAPDHLRLCRNGRRGAAPGGRARPAGAGGGHPDPRSQHDGDLQSP